MGYRSDGALWLSDKAKKQLTEELKTDLDTAWEYNSEDDIWEFNYWKWYTSYADVKAWEDFMASLPLEDYDFVRIGEDTADIDVYTHTKFYTYTNWGIN